MASAIRDSWARARQIEAALKAILKQDHPLYDDVDTLLVQMRVACETTMFLDFDYATKQGVEARLWDIHSTINNRYRKLVQYFRNGEQKKHVVERRKMEKRYVDFIKTSQYFYKGYIQRLASHFTGLERLRRIADSLSLSSLSADDRVQVSPEVAKLIELSCHATLLRLGDLSRYRNELRTKGKSWDSALGYYSLASELRPESGSSQNQMAVIALAEGNHLDALYYLYRALATIEPHPIAKKNLEIELKKITTAWEKGIPVKGDSEATLVLWFVRLQAKFYKGLEFATREELENEVLHQLAVHLKEERLSPTILERFVIINLAAEYIAAERYSQEQTEELGQAYMYFLGFNIRMLFLFLQIILPELEDPTDGDDLPTDSDDTTAKPPRDRITIVTRRVLPALRQYSSWLVSRAKILNIIVDAHIKLHLKELHIMYALVLTRMVAFFRPPNLPEVSYLLEEDSATIGFKPLQDPDLPPQCNFYTVEGGGLLKARLTDPGTKRELPNTEMLSRARDILLCGMTLAIDDIFPVNYDPEVAFIYTEKGMEPISPAVTHQPQYPVAVMQPEVLQPEVEIRDAVIFHPATAPQSESTDEVGGITEAHQNMELYLDNMVNESDAPPKNTMASDETSYGMHSQTANDVFASTSIDQNGFKQHRQSIGTPKMLPSLGGIWGAPFTPSPKELQPMSPDQPATARQPSFLQSASNEHHTAFTFGGTPEQDQSAWINWSKQPVNQQLQETMARQYMPQSSEFSNSSSIYANTPMWNTNAAVLSRGTYSGANGNSTTVYPGASAFEREVMLQSSLPRHYASQARNWTGSNPTPPGGQGG
ncbi:telomerase activating protein Est1 [Phlyctema vagabunda]|uniref:Telomerase activating protein Est1 n=1 Tax=Phlyctema vagabunda TaxID=108571 RepID=A0ABR4PUA7_9HELO